VLPNHDGKCARLHGHSYRVDVLLAGPVREADGSPGEGMVLDFANVSDAWKPLHAQLDHAYLNHVLPDEFQPTTAENIAAFIYERLRWAHLPLASVRVWETATSFAEVGRVGWARELDAERACE